MLEFDLLKVYGFDNVKTTKGAAIDFRDEDLSGQLGTKLGKAVDSTGGGAGGGEEA